jgi:hypothetical protein
MNSLAPLLTLLLKIRHTLCHKRRPNYIQKVGRIYVPVRLRPNRDICTVLRMNSPVDGKGIQCGGHCGSGEGSAGNTLPGFIIPAGSNMYFLMECIICNVVGSWI